ncbi:uncharacterized protein [Nothobranchius furzeri]
MSELVNGVKIMALVKEEAHEEQSAGEDQQEPEHLHIKEEQDDLWTSLEREQLHLKETDAARFLFTAGSIKSEDDEEKPLVSQLHQQQTEDRDVPASSSADHVTAEMTSHLATRSSGCCVSKECVIVKQHADSCREVQKKTKTFSCDHCGKEFIGKSSLNSHMRIHTGQKPFACELCGKSFCQKTSLNSHMTVHTGQKPFACELCGQRFNLRTHLNRHIRIHTGQTPFACELCGKRFRHETSLNYHLSVHTGHKPFACGLCGQKFSHKTHVKDHMRIHTGQKPFACDLCGQRFNRKTTLNVHMRIHSGQKPFACELCGQRFKRKTNLNSHMRIHTGQKPFACELCGKRFSHTTSLKGHIRVHTGQKPFACGLCGQKFSHKTHIKDHMRVHTGQKPFACELCGQRFTRQSTLNIHIRIHTGQKPFACELCGQRFRHETSLKDHMCVHTGQKPFACGLCGKRFRHETRLKSHLSVHTGPFACDLCGKRFRHETRLKSHMSVHTGQMPFACDLCGKRFRHETRLKSHMSVHTGHKPFVCELCGRRFSHKNNLNIHMTIHTGLKPFACELCGQRFNQKTTLNSHMRIHTGQNPYACELCGQRFRYKASLNSHMSVHTGQKPFACELCGKGFNRKTDLNRHTRVHTGQKPFICELCGQGFSQKISLNNHTSVHPGQKPFGCVTWLPVIQRSEKLIQTASRVDFCDFFKSGLGLLQFNQSLLFLCQTKLCFCPVSLSLLKCLVSAGLFRISSMCSPAQSKLKATVTATLHNWMLLCSERVRAECASVPPGGLSNTAAPKFGINLLPGKANVARLGGRLVLCRSGKLGVDYHDNGACFDVWCRTLPLPSGLLAEQLWVKLVKAGLQFLLSPVEVGAMVQIQFEWSATAGNKPSQGHKECITVNRREHLQMNGSGGEALEYQAPSFLSTTPNLDDNGVHHLWTESSATSQTTSYLDKLTGILKLLGQAQQPAVALKGFTTSTCAFQLRYSFLSANEGEIEAQVHMGSKAIHCLAAVGKEVICRILLGSYIPPYLRLGEFLNLGHPCADKHLEMAGLRTAEMIRQGRVVPTPGLVPQLLYYYLRSGGKGVFGQASFGTSEEWHHCFFGSLELGEALSPKQWSGIAEHPTHLLPDAVSWAIWCCQPDWSGGSDQMGMISANQEKRMDMFERLNRDISQVLESLNDGARVGMLCKPQALINFLWSLGFRAQLRLVKGLRSGTQQTGILVCRFSIDFMKDLQMLAFAEVACFLKGLEYSTLAQTEDLSLGTTPHTGANLPVLAGYKLYQPDVLAAGKMLLSFLQAAYPTAVRHVTHTLAWPDPPYPSSVASGGRRFSKAIRRRVNSLGSLLRKSGIRLRLPPLLTEIDLWSWHVILPWSAVDECCRDMKGIHLELPTGCLDWSISRGMDAEHRLKGHSLGVPECFLDVIVLFEVWTAQTKCFESFQPKENPFVTLNGGDALMTVFFKNNNKSWRLRSGLVEVEIEELCQEYWRSPSTVGSTSGKNSPVTSLISCSSAHEQRVSSSSTCTGPSHTRHDSLSQRQQKDQTKGSDDDAADVSLEILNKETLESTLQKFFDKAEKHAKDRFDSLDSQLDSIRSTLDKHAQELETQKQVTTLLQKRVRCVEDASVAQSADLQKHQRKIPALDDQSRRNNIRILNLKEGIELNNALSYLRSNLLVWFPELAGSPPDVTRVRRVGQPGASGSPRTLVVCFLRANDRDRILALARKSEVSVAGKSVQFAADFSDETVRRRRRCFPVLSRARALGLQAFLLYPANIKVISDAPAEGGLDFPLSFIIRFWLFRRAGVKIMALVKEEAHEEQSAGEDRQEPEHLHIKEEQDDLWTSLEREQLHLKETDAARFLFTAGSIKSEDDEEKPLVSQLLQQHTEDRDVPVSSSADHVTAEMTSHLATRSSGCCVSKECVIVKQHADSCREVQKKTKTFSCDHCGKEFMGESSLNSHMRIHTGQKSFACELCGKRFTRKTTLNSHMRIHTGQKPFACELCGKSFCHKTSLNSHMTVHTGQKPFACELCGQRFNLRTTLNRHIRIHTGQTPFACELCGKRFRHETSLNYHMSVHTGHKPFACGLCGQKFSHKTHIKDHMRIHTGQKPFACELCGQRFNRQTTLNSHMRIHSGQKPFACELCGQRFKRKTNLNCHMRIHTGQKPFACELCGKRFSHMTNLKGHMRVHTGQKPFACGLCGQKFSYKTHIKDHMRIHTGQKPFSCELCGQRFTRRSTLNRHIRIHTGQMPFACELCGQRFRYETSLKGHMSVHTGHKPFACGLCGQKFSQNTHIKDHMRIHTEEKPFACELCGKRFNCKTNLNRHIRIHTGQKPVDCDLCGQKFSLKTSLKDHMRIHSGQKLFVCELCGQRFNRKTHLKDHMRIHTGQKLFACELCGQRFNRQTNLNRHIRTHTGQAPFACELCGKRFRNETSLKSHMSVHTGHKPFACELCGQTFKRKTTLNSHMIIHTGQKPFACELCGKRFNYKTNLNRHIRIHTGLKPFACELCGQRFNHKLSLNGHMSVHTGQKPFACELCGQRFNQKTTLNCHMRVHTGQKPFVCELCGQRFSYKKSLNGHMSVHTGQKPFVCELCGQRFSHKKNLNIHMTIHTGLKPFVCEHCGQRFNRKASLNSHMRIHTGQKPFACEFCGQRFRYKASLNSHMSVHTGQKPFACELCGKGFNRKTDLNRHTRVHTGQKPFICELCGQGFSQKKSLNNHTSVHPGQKPFGCVT